MNRSATIATLSEREIKLLSMISVNIADRNARGVIDAGVELHGIQRALSELRRLDDSQEDTRWRRLLRWVGAF